MSIIEAIFLGIIQGLTEFLPVSSSGHLYIAEWLFGMNNVPDSFEVALHLGTLFVIGIYFFKDWINLIVGAYKQTIKKEKNVHGTMFWYLVIATIPSGIIGYILDKTFEETLTKPLVIAISLMVMGIVLYFVDKKSKSETDYEHLTFKQTFITGMSQALAFIPGVSRSGVTITTARALGVERKTAARYSFMLSAPIILAATALKITEFELTLTFMLGILTSFLVGLCVIHWVMKYLEKGSFKPFAIYRVAFGLFIILRIILMK